MFIKTKDVCDQLNISPNTVKNMIRQGDLPTIRVGKGYRFRQSDIEDYIRRQTVNATETTADNH